MTSPTKRRSPLEMQLLLDHIRDIIALSESRITIRHLYYRLVGLSVIEKTEAAYKSLCGHLTKWRRQGEISYDAFSDSTRWHIQQRTFDSVQESLSDLANNYRRNLWRDQLDYLEIWTEKDAIASIIADVALPYLVPVFVCRGFASLSSLYDASHTFREQAVSGKRCFIYHFGDYDPSGVAAGESVRKAFRDDFHLDIEFTRAAVTEQQIEELNLPTRPVKKSDSRSARWTGGDSVELDTLPPSELQAIVNRCITPHIDFDQWELSRNQERADKGQLQKILNP